MLSTFRILSRFIIFNLIFLMLSGPFVVLYGPFDNIKNTFIGTLATSMHRHWLYYFLNEEKVEEIIAKQQNNIDLQQNKSINISSEHSNEIKFSKIDGSRFKGYLLEIKDPTRLKVAISRNLGVSGQTTSEIAKQSGAIAAINAGGFYDPKGTGTGRLPMGIVIHDGYFIVGNDYKGNFDIVGFNNNGILIAGKYSVKELKEMKIQEAITFAPVLIFNGKKQPTSGTLNGIQPRTAIGQKEDGTILMLVIDGRQTNSVGATLLDVQNILYENGAYIAANLDGGSSATMYYNNKIVNRPCDMLGERSIPTAFIVK